MSHLDDFVKEFLLESREGLDQLDSDLIALEENPRSQERCDSAFRTLHTIKGNAGFLDFHRLGELAHAGEHVLQSIRSGDIEFTPAVADALLELLDVLRRMLVQIEQSGSEGDDRFEGMEERLHSLVAPSKAAAARTDPQSYAQTMTFSKESDQGIEELDDSPVVEDFDQPTLARPVPSGSSGSRSSEEFAPATKPDDSAADDSSPGSATDELGKDAVAAQGSSPPIASGSSLVLDVDSSRGSSQARGSTPSLVRVDVHLLDRLMNLVGELVLARNQIVEMFGDHTGKSTSNPVQRLNLLTSEIQEGVLKTRMQRIGNLWQRYPRMVRDLARNCRKDVTLDISGDDTELDKTLLEALSDPLLHLIRNAIDHGIETPKERLAGGKPESGRLSLRAWHQGGHVHIEVSDDGGGLDLDRIRDKAVHRGLVTKERADALEDDELQQLLFMPGFSTTESITSVSGRGVGLDVVRTNIEDIGGTVDLESVSGEGTTTHITVPLTLAIIPALIVSQSGQRYAIPQVNVIELINLEGEDAQQPGERFHNAPVYRLRGEVLPLMWLSELFGHEIQPGPVDSEDGLSIVVLQAGARRFALVVDGVSGTEEIVVKPIGSVLDNLIFYTGATIMGDGTVALILDILGLARHAGLVVRQQAESAMSQIVRVADAQDHLLVCSVGRRQIGLSLTDVTRLTSIARDEIELAGRSELMQDEEELISLIHTAALLGESGRSRAERLPVVVHSHDQGPVGLIVDRIENIVSEPAGSRDHVLQDDSHARLINGKVTDMIDVPGLVAQAAHGPSGSTESTPSG